ncbi:MAG TPA: diguanylate cyclase [Herbaspirillum sp.]|jgi:diguanylate cyclase
MYKTSTAQMAVVLARGDARRLKKNTNPLRNIVEKIVHGAAGPQRSHSAAMLLADHRRLRESADRAQRELELARARIRVLESQLQQMDELVHEDQLTGALNRRGLDDAFEREFARAARGGATLCVALLDLDNFKHINDSHGHAAGDAVLMHFAKIVNATLRSMDVLARFGGEEFVILLPATTPVEAMITLARIQAELAANPCQHEGRSLPVTFSAGATAYQVEEEKYTLMKRADAAVYKAKHAGKDQAIFSGWKPHLVQDAIAA